MEGEQETSQLPGSTPSDSSAASPGGAVARSQLETFAEMPPRASAVMHSLRAVGYDLPTAIADIIDNSLAAAATRARVDMTFDGADSHIRIEDNGRGMDAAVLDAAMRLGSHHPGATRERTDHGRFGLGLKTASLGQCRRLTVRSRGAAGHEETRSWDLDHVEVVDAWSLRRSAWDARSEERLGSIAEGSTGTVVLWEKLDRTVEVPGRSTAHADFDRKISETVDHLSMVFHRLIDARENPVCIEVNGRKLEGWDPLLSRHKLTTQLRDARLMVGTARMHVVPYIIPPAHRLSPEDARRAAGPHGWLAHQGFYLYRNRRLLVTGGWLGLAKREEHFSLARIRLDVDNQLDDLLRIDIRKARARIPDQVRPRMQTIVDATRKAAAEIWRGHATRAGRSTGEKVVSVWLVDASADRATLRVNPEHPAVLAVRGRLAGDAPLLDALLSIVGTALPPGLLSGVTGGAAQPAPAAATVSVPPEVQALTREIVTALRRDGINPAELRRRLSVVEPWASMQIETLDKLVETLS